MKKYICAECGSTHIQRKAWIDPNTDKVFEFCEDADTNYQECWCQDCKEFTEWTTENEEEE